MTSEEIIEALRKASRIGLTAAQAAEMIGIAANTARRRAKAAGFQFVNARRVLNQAIRDEQIVTKKKVEAKKAAQTYQKRIDDIKKKAAGIKCPIERKEMIYGAALLAFERRQHDDDRRPKPPCDVRPAVPSLQRKRSSGYNWQPVEIDGVRFASRTAAADALGVSRGELSSMISDRASPHRRMKLAYLINEYQDLPDQGQPSLG